jgi:hypothetical protein
MSPELVDIFFNAPFLHKNSVRHSDLISLPATHARFSNKSKIGLEALVTITFDLMNSLWGLDDFFSEKPPPYP